jgi:hypothetical protein
MVARSERAKPGVQGFPSHIDVKAEFVDEIPVLDPNENWKGRKHPDFIPTPGVREAMMLAFKNPKRAMLLMEYVEGAPSKRRNMAEMRVRALKEQGYSERNGWIVVAREAKVYVSYTGVGLDD